MFLAAFSMSKGINFMLINPCFLGYIYLFLMSTAGVCGGGAETFGVAASLHDFIVNETVSSSSNSLKFFTYTITQTRDHLI